jgi:DNA-binding beta-propeller fold protein YncE
MAIRFGSGSLQFELVHGWERIPAGWSHPDVAGVCTDSSGNVFLYCRGDHPVMIYDREGRFLDSWGEGLFSYRTHGMFMGNGDEMFLVDDGGNSVGRYSPDGKLLQQIGPAGILSDTGYDGRNVTSITHGGEPFNHPTNLAAAPSGDLYVSDGYGNCRIHRFSAEAELLQSWGEPGMGPGQFHLPHSAWVHTDGRVFVADRQNDRIQIFGPTGEYLSEWIDVRRPQDIFIRDGLVYVGELLYRKGDVSLRRGTIGQDEPNRLSIYDLEGNCVLRWGDLDGTRDGYFIAPHGIWVDDEGSIYLAEVTHTIVSRMGLGVPETHTIQKFART